MALQADLVERTLHLSEPDRAELARQLLQSLESAPIESADSNKLDETIENRLEELDGSEMSLIDWRDSVERARDALKTESNR